MTKKTPAHPTKDYEGIGTKLKVLIMRLIEIINFVAFYVAVGGSAAEDTVHTNLGDASYRPHLNKRGDA